MRLSRVISLVLLTSLPACSSAPWYQRYGIASEHELAKPASVPKLIKALRSGEVSVVERSGRALARIGEPAVQPLIAEVRRGSQAAIWVLGEMGAGAAGAVPALIAALGHRERYVRQETIEALGKLGPAARPALPTLIEVLRGDESRRVRKRVPEALVSIVNSSENGEGHGEVERAIRRATKDDSWRVRRAARAALPRLRVAAARAIPRSDASAPKEAQPRKAKRSPVVAVFDLQDSSGQLDQKTRDQLSDYLAAQVTALAGFKVVPREQLRARLVQQKTGGYRECFDQGCQIELGKALAAEKSLSTKILRVGKGCTLAAMLFDLKTETAERAASMDLEAGCTDEAIKTALGEVARKLKLAPSGT
jgi:hypothetical protein